MMYLGRRNQGCITLLASVIPPYKTHMIVLADNSPLTDDDDELLDSHSEKERTKNFCFTSIIYSNHKIS
jgi:uncharacterized protein YegL